MNNEEIIIDIETEDLDIDIETEDIEVDIDENETIEVDIDETNPIELDIDEVEDIEIEMSSPEEMEIELSNITVITSNSYNDLEHKPLINDVLLIGNRSLEELDIQKTMNNITNLDIERLIGE